MLGLTPLTPAYPYPFPPPPTAKRANTLLLKNKLVELLPQSAGEAYWSLLCNLLTGKITQEEFEIGWRTSLSNAELESSNPLQPIDVSQLEYLHNALLLSILYNTTKPTLPPASVSHQGWSSKRKRGALLSAEEQGADVLGELSRKRRRIKRLVGGMTKSEKKRLSVLLTAANATAEAASGSKKAGAPTASSSKLGVGASSGLKTPSTAAFQQELTRCQAAPSCLEALELPDIGTLNDRMSAVAYTSGVTKGVDSEAAGMAAVALDVYMRDLITALINTRPQVGGTPSATASDAVPSSGINLESSKTQKPKASQKKTMTMKKRKKTLTARNLSTLLTMTPSLVHAPHLSSVERFTSHEALRSAPSRSQRIKHLEKAQKTRTEARSLPSITIEGEGEQQAGVDKEVTPHTSSALPIDEPQRDSEGKEKDEDTDREKEKDKDKDKDKGEAQEGAATTLDAAPSGAPGGDEVVPKQEEDSGAEFSTQPEAMVIDKPEATQGATRPSPTPVSLEAELFPELPTTAVASPAPPKTNGEADKESQTAAESTDKKDQQEKRENKIKAFHEMGDVASSDEEDDRHGPNHARKPNKDGKQDKTGSPQKTHKEQKSHHDKKDRGRLGLWKILTDILEGGARQAQVKSIA